VKSCSGSKLACLKELRGGRNWSWNNQRGDMNKLKPTPKYPSSLRGGINTRR